MTIIEYSQFLYSHLMHSLFITSEFYYLSENLSKNVTYTLLNKIGHQYMIAKQNVVNFINIIY